MDPDAVLHIGREALVLVLVLSAAPVLAAMAVGLVVSLFQAATQIQEQTLTFVRKLAGVALVILLAGHWMLGETIAFTHSLFNMIPQLIQS